MLIEGIEISDDWIFQFSGFKKGQVLEHEDSCILFDLAGEEWDEDKCNCEPKLVDRVSAVITAHLYSKLTVEGFKEGETLRKRIDRNIYCNIPLIEGDYKEDIEWMLPCYYNNIMMEDLRNGMDTILTLIKFYEVMSEEVDMSTMKIRGKDISTYTYNLVMNSKQGFKIGILPSENRRCFI